jgi:hypothetical protein
VKIKAILGKKECTRKATNGRKSSMRACMEDLMTLGLGFLQNILMVGELETYKYRYLGLIGEGNNKRGEREKSEEMDVRKRMQCNIFLYDLIL